MRVPGAVADPSRLETRTVTYPSGDATITAYLARAPGDAPRPAIVVIHDAFGVGAHFPDVARRLANVGFDAIVPDLYARTGTPDPTDRAALFAAARQLTDANCVSDLDGAAAVVRSLPNATGKVGVIGFCLGGRQALLWACCGARVDAAINCWGGSVFRASPQEETTPARPTPVIDLTPNLQCPILIVSGDQDHNPTPEENRRLKERLDILGKDATLRIFPGVGHAFFADYHTQLYNEAAAFELWSLILEFFNRHLR
ncbi:MAG: dienelactone hydrolase family protein [Dehalococcoidia bacterium]|nr:dienelactone hydrolase family protein [Dehalococcoidia bacterium]